VTDVNRTRKFGVACRNLQDLKRKACSKLNVSTFHYDYDTIMKLASISFALNWLLYTVIIMYTVLATIYYTVIMRCAFIHTLLMSLK
jgi:3',5'-cyclic AMP phosphodiesterase CpdA